MANFKKTLEESLESFMKKSMKNPVGFFTAILGWISEKYIEGVRRGIPEKSQGDFFENISLGTSEINE